MDESELERCEFATEIFYKFSTSKEVRLKYGAKCRNEMQKALKAGKKLTGYRADWLLKTIDDIVKVLIRNAEKFDNTHFHDMISVDDMKDALTSTISRLETKSKKTKN